MHIGHFFNPQQRLFARWIEYKQDSAKPAHVDQALLNPGYQVQNHQREDTQRNGCTHIPCAHHHSNWGGGLNCRGSNRAGDATAVGQNDSGSEKVNAGESLRGES
jgi:hypothetical protein